MDEELASVAFFTRQVYLFADTIGLPRDQVLFFACSFLAFLGGIVFNLLLPPVRTRTHIRHTVLTVAGVFLLFYCYGIVQTGILLGVSLISQLLMVYGPRDYMHGSVFIVAMGCLAGTHVYNMYYSFGVYKVDYTGVLMVMTAKISGLAFALHDGKYKKREQLSAFQKELLISEFPGTLEYFSYLFNFPCALGLPMASYKEYEVFVSGSNLPDDVKTGKKMLISNLAPAFGKAFSALLFLGFHVYFSSIFPILYIAEDEFFAKYNFVVRLLYTYVAGVVLRSKYYFAFGFTEAICNASGLGYVVDKDGKASWEGCMNMKPFIVEFGTSPKVAIENWNIQIARWLRSVAYERFPWAPRIATFVLSAVWHGFYGGYLISFPFCGLMGEAAVRMRRFVRHRFQPDLATVYDHITRVGTMFILEYVMIPFMTMEFWLGIKAWKHLYFYGHILIIGAMLFVPGKKRQPTAPAANDKKTDTSVDAGNAAKAHAE